MLDALYIVWLIVCLELHKIDKALLEQSSHPTNLLVTFLEYSSIVMQDTKGQAYKLKFV